jgi:ABC-type uncharacterized transport system substrate-binding protein
MVQTKKMFRLAIVIILCMWGSFPATIQAAKFKVLVVMSYEQINPWSKEIKEGIDAELANSCEILYFYMDTKINFEGGRQKAKEAYSLYQKLQPDGVITADDNAQWMFVLPHLKDKVNTPVMFCGINAEAAKYGYPSSNVSGILERGHIRESIALAKQLSPSIRTVGFIAKDSPSGKALLRQVEGESGTYLAKVATCELVRTVKELVALEAELKEQCDAIYTDSMEGILDAEGKPLHMKEIMRILAKVFGKPLIGANWFHVEQGALCAVVKTGQEQGRIAAEMLLKAMQGTPVSKIPITRNFRGRRVINVTAMERLGLRPRPIVFLGAKLVRTEK